MKRVRGKVMMRKWAMGKGAEMNRVKIKDVDTGDGLVMMMMRGVVMMTMMKGVMVMMIGAVVMMGAIRVMAMVTMMRRVSVMVMVMGYG